MDYCSRLRGLFYPTAVKEIMIDEQIENLGEVIKTLEERIRQFRQEQASLKNTIKSLNDPSIRFEGNGTSRKLIIEKCKRRLLLTLKFVEDLEKQVTFYTQTKFNLERSQMATEMAMSISALRDQLSSVQGIDLSQLRGDMDEIDETNQEMQEVTNFMQDNFNFNTWNTDMGEMEQMLEDYLVESDEENNLESIAEEMSEASLSPKQSSKTKVEESSEMRSTSKTKTRKTTEAHAATPTKHKKTNKSKKTTSTVDIVTDVSPMLV